MAQKRMFDKRITDSDKFIDLPNSSKALYFMAGMSADDRGFFQPRKLQKLCGFTDDDFKVLIAKGYFITFDSGVIVITDWNKNNYLDKNRITETEYVDELKLLKVINEKYELNDACLTPVKRLFNQYSIEENRIEENSIYIIPDKKPKKIKNRYGEFDNVLLTDDEYHKLENSNLLTYIDRLSSYIESKGKRYKSHYATILNWSRKDAINKNTENKKETAEDMIKRLRKEMNKND